ncbi:hypothetical protein [uncultured Gimesia sp.]|uniref:hypothetical protein n=1 Tax=uncultured Gimesia sp. TaxID=1678688 RepID=UPI0030D73E25|tara:strand:+ start:8454 stop:9317 length:864 start_codon:yes stop_codon:yes gene_type:complete
MYGLQKTVALTILIILAASGQSASAQNDYFKRIPSQRYRTPVPDNFSYTNAPFPSNDGIDRDTCLGSNCPLDRVPQDFICPYELKRRRQQFPGNFHEFRQYPENDGENGSRGQPDVPTPISNLEASAERIFDTIRFEMRTSSEYEMLLTGAWELNRSVRYFVVSLKKADGENHASEALKDVKKAFQDLRQSLNQSRELRRVQNTIYSFEQLLSNMLNRFQNSPPQPFKDNRRFDKGNDQFPQPSRTHDHSHSHSHGNNGLPNNQDNSAADTVPPPPTDEPELLLPNG